jgi:putative tryptophan/tyrosine transport system substrate-binding protein
MLVNNSSQSKAQKGWAVLAGVMIMALLVSGCGAKQPKKVYQVGIISLNAFAAAIDGFKAEMTALGYVEGENIVYVVREHSIDAGPMQESINQFVADKVDLIFVTGTPPATMAKATTVGTNIPVLFANSVVDGNGLIDSVQVPGANLTGVRFPGADLTVKRLEFLVTIAPQAKRILAAYDPKNLSAAGAIVALRPAALSAGKTLVEVQLTSVEDLSADLQAREALDDIGIDAILIMPEGLTQSPAGWPIISEFAAKHKIPVGGSATFESSEGAIFSFFPDNYEVGRLAAALADKIFKGTPAGTIPVVSPESQLIFNYKLAQELGLTIPEGLLKQAFKIIR